MPAVAATWHRARRGGTLLPMILSELHLGMRVSHPQYGEGEVRAINGYGAEIRFADGVKPVEPEASSLMPAEATAVISGGSIPLKVLIDRTVEAALDRMGVEKPEASIHELAGRWRGGRIVIAPAGSCGAIEGGGTGGFLPQAGDDAEPVAGVGTEDQRE